MSFQDMNFSDDPMFREVIANFNNISEGIIEIVTQNTVEVVSTQNYYDARLNEIDNYGVLVKTKNNEMYYFEMCDEPTDMTHRACHCAYTIREREKESYDQNDIPLLHLIFVCKFDPYRQNKQIYSGSIKIYKKDREVIQGLGTCKGYFLNITYDSNENNELLN